jgi:hypothetical protein
MHLVALLIAPPVPTSSRHVGSLTTDGLTQLEVDLRFEGAIERDLHHRGSGHASLMHKFRTKRAVAMGSPGQ